jgi:putative PIN family toxin of toxin-antitoxin system
MIRVVLDTNVLYAGLYSSRGAAFQLLQAIEYGKLKMIISTTLLFEYEDVLKRHQSVLGVSDEDIDALLDSLCLKSEHHRIHFLWRPQLSDTKDDHLLELAVTSGTRLIATYNTKHFKDIAVFGVRSITPKELMEEL